jgi:death-on-curing protein
MIVWLQKALVLAIHERQLAEHGGSAGVRDDGLLESALARPQQSYAYGDPAPDLADLGAALAHGLARNHPFVDGNKRTAHVTYRVFLELNGEELEATDEEKYVAMLALAEGKLTERGFAAWLRERLRLAPRNQAHEPRKRYRVKRSNAASTRTRGRSVRRPRA